MELNDIKTYLAISIIGLMVGILYVAIQNDIPRMLLIFYITVYIVATLRFLLERRYYKKHKAILASLQFLLLPYLIFLMGNYVSTITNLVRIFLITIDLSSGGSIRIYFNLISISLLFPFSILLIFFSRFYSGRWPGIAIKRKIRRGKTLPFFLHTFFLIPFLIGFFINWKIDFLSFLFIIFYLIYIFRYFVFVSVSKTSRQITVSSSSSTATSTTRGTSKRGDIPTASRSGQRSIPTQPRMSSTTSRSSTQRTSGSKVSRVSIEPGIEISTSRVSTTKKTTVTKSMFPTGTPKQEEMKCIICYMDFDKKDKRRIILCPHCKYPAHEDEFLSWFKTSRLCARCNQNISVKYVNNPKYRISIKIYIEKIIEKL